MIHMVLIIGIPYLYNQLVANIGFCYVQILRMHILCRANKDLSNFLDYEQANIRTDSKWFRQTCNANERLRSRTLCALALLSQGQYSLILSFSLVHISASYTLHSFITSI